MASYGYGYGGGQSQSYSNVQAAGSYPAQSSSGAYASQAHYAPPVSSTPRQMVQQGYDVGSYAPSSSAYGYGRQDQTSSLQSSSYGASSYMGRDSASYDTKSYYSSNSQGATYSGYGSQGMKQSGYSTPASGSGIYPSSQVQGGMGHISKQSQSYMSQSNTGSSGYVGYGRQGQTHTSASSGYASSQGSNQQSGSFSNQHSSASSNVSSQHQPPSQQHKAPQKGVQHANTYESVVYNAATNFLQQQTQQTKGTWQKSDRPQFRLNQNQKMQQRPPFQRQPPKQAQLHYCEVCKISCAGPQTYKEHLEGQRHKKKAASVQTQNKEPVPPGSFRCELCDVTCTGTDAYAAHVKGARHVKTVKLHQKLGKPVPEITLPSTSSTVKKTVPDTTPTVTNSTTQKINFVGGSKLISTGSGVTESSTSTSTTASTTTTATTSSAPVLKELMATEEAEIVGEEFIENIQSDVGKVIGYKCTLCDCRFNDDVARNAHVKGRRHRLNYKKKVKPDLKVDIKDTRMRRFGRERDERLTRQMKEKEMMFRQRQEEQMRWERELTMREEELRRWEEEEYMKRVEEDRYWTRPDRQRMMEMEFYEWERRIKFHDPSVPPGGPPQNGGPPPVPSPDDRLIMAKHTAIYPNEAELQQVQNIVAAAEKALKLVSDHIAEEQKPKEKESKMEVEEGKQTDGKKEDGTVAEAKEEEKKPEIKPLVEKKKPTPTPQRFLKGVMRVDVLAKGLLLHGRLDVQLVILCADKPTKTMLAKVYSLLPEKVKTVSEEQFEISQPTPGSSIQMKTTSGPECTVKIQLTSPVMREGQGDEVLKPKVDPMQATIDENDILDKEHCLQALASLRHANWFQARANGVQSCVYIIRIMRDLCNRVPAFQPLKDWAVELLVEKTLSSSPNPLGPGEAFRRVMEAISSGIFLPGGPGLLDPCEKEPVDAAANLTDQEREDITAAAQHALRLHAFRQLHKVLGIDPLKPPERRRGHGFGRNKRRHEDTVSGENEVSKIQKKEAEEKIAAAAAAALAAAKKDSGSAVKEESASGKEAAAAE